MKLRQKGNHAAQGVPFGGGFTRLWLEWGGLFVEVLKTKGITIIGLYRKPVACKCCKISMLEVGARAGSLY